MAQIWTDDYISFLSSQEGPQAVNVEVPFIFKRRFLAVTEGVSVYNLDENVKSIISISWRGLKIDPINSLDAKAGYPTQNVDDSLSMRGRPEAYVQYETDRRAVRLFPTPNESLAAGTTPELFKPVRNEPYCVLTYWAYYDQTEGIPTYIDRRILKAYTAMRAFGKEGPGQDLKASAYWKQRYEFLIGLLKDINQQIFVSKRYTLSPDYSSSMRGRRPPRPSLPPNFERVTLR